MANGNELIIKKVRKGGDHGHHGGAWKVAYADFVTAMMAFFLLLWLLNATTEAQKAGIADYFSPASLSKTNSGAGQILGGTSISLDGSKASDQTTGGVLLALPSTADPSEMGEGYRETDPAEVEAARTEDEEVDEKDFEKLQAEREEEEFARAERELREAIENVPALAQLAESLIIDHTPEGLRIQIVDQEKLSMFPLGSSAMYDHTKTLLGHVSTVIQSLPNRLSVSGHTDALPYAADKSYTNWELSSDRANASRRALLDSGFPAGRIARVVGLAETEPLIAEDPADPRNRRISIVILREGGATPASEKARREQETENLGAALERAFSPAAGGDQAEP
ncbi:MAG: flagellar motor protein MotB [Rhodospirillaceae bacterium]|jgi:chemotaxis protein MotB|nr:flagellar motor protein MotB [Rhodospirillaceae bacterium]